MTKNLFLGMMFAVGLTVLSAVFFIYDAKSEAPTEKLIIQTKSGTEHVFHVEVADTPEKREVGLMFRKEMPKDHGMLFPMGRPEQVIQFWMKNTLIPLDIIFVDGEGRIQTIKKGQPLSLVPISSNVPVIAAIELNEGVTEELDIRPGDTVKHPYFQ